jgi:hypothetical protein
VENKKPASFRPVNRQQVVLVPLDVEQLIPPDHPARNIWEILGRMDLSGFLGAVKSVEGQAGRKIREHLKLAPQHVEQLQREEAEQEKRTRQAAAKRRAARERAQRLEQALAEVERLQTEKKTERAKPCPASVSDADAQFMWTSDHGLAQMP